MHLTIFQSDKGDCLLLRSKDGKNMLIDGGMRTSYTQYVAPTLHELAQEGQALDLIYVSHIDQDHISGVLQLMDDTVAWRVYDFHRGSNPHIQKPRSWRPPAVRAIWHNAFHEQLQENAGPIEDMLAATATVLSGADDQPAIAEAAEEYGQLATSTGEAIQLSRRIGEQQLKIPLNEIAGYKLIMLGEVPDHIPLGSMKLRVIGPAPDDLSKLREEWNEWLEKKRTQLKRIQTKARRDEENLAHGGVGASLQPAIEQGYELGGLELAEARELGRRDKVTTPNLASLMLLAEEDGKTILLTGDGHWQDIVNGLKEIGVLHDGGHLRVDVLKVQHHGSEHNISAEFCEAVSAEHYVFCGNGAHANPDLDVIQLIVNARLQQSGNFKLWFNSSHLVPGKAENQDHMKRVGELMVALQKSTPARFTSEFLNTAKIDLEI